MTFSFLPVSRHLSPTTVTLFVFAACGSNQAPPRTLSPPSVDQFVQVLATGAALYGVGIGCDEWRSVPEPPAEPDTAEDEGPDPDASSQPPVDEVQPTDDRNRVRGRLIAHADSEGRIFQFGYNLDRSANPLRLRISGRGSWAPAPGVNDTQQSVIGIARYCSSDAEVRVGSAAGEFRIGDEQWFLTREACQKGMRTARLENPSCSPRTRSAY